MGPTPGSTPPDRPPVGSVVEMFGEPWKVTGYNDAGTPLFEVKSESLEGDEDGFEVGTPADEKASTLRSEARALFARAQRVSGAERDWALSKGNQYMRRSSALASPSRPRGCSAGRREARPAARRTSRTSSSSRTSSNDPGSSEEPEPAPATARPCAAPWCDHPVYGASQKRFCGTERCDRARAEERQRNHRATVVDLVAAERERQLTNARKAQMVGAKAFAAAEEHALSYLWRHGLVNGDDPGEQEAISRFRRGSVRLIGVAA